MQEFINPTALSLADLMRGHPDPRLAAAIMNKWYAKMVGVEPSDVKTIIIDNNTCFPLFHTDTLETIINRFAKMFPIEAKATIELIGEGKKDNPDGRSGAGLLRSLMSIPVILKAAIVAMYGESWFSSKKNIKTLAKLMPKFCTCEVNKL